MPRTAVQIGDFKGRLRAMRRGVQLWHVNMDREVVPAGLAAFTENDPDNPILTVSTNGAPAATVQIEDTFDVEDEATAEAAARRPAPAR